MALHASVISIIIWKEDASLLNFRYSSTNQQLFAKDLCNESVTLKIMDNKWKPSHAYRKIDTFHGEQR